MFFFLIRASNQLSPKMKVVHLLFLYNFYFGQISSCYMKFGVLFGQNQVKFIEPGHCSSTVLGTVSPRRHTSDSGRRRASTRRPSRLSAALLLSRTPRSFLSRPVPPFSFLSARRAEASRARRTGRRSSSRRPTLTTPLRSRAPRAAQLHPESTPHLPEHGRALLPG